MGVVRLIAPFVVICFATGALFAQTPTLESAVQRKVDLTVAQKQILYQSIGNIPQIKGLETAMVEGQVLLVEPQGKTIVAVIALEL